MIRDDAGKHRQELQMVNIPRDDWRRNATVLCIAVSGEVLGYDGNVSRLTGPVST